MNRQDNIYASQIFLNAALPLAKVVAERVPKLGAKFVGKNCVYQVSFLDKELGKQGTHFTIDDGVWTVHKGLFDTTAKDENGVSRKIDFELEFPSIELFNLFMAGKTKKLPKLKGVLKLGKSLPFLFVMLKMASVLQSKDIPADKADAELLVRLYFYLLSSGISTLNKAGHPEVHEWAMKSPDRVYAFGVEGYDDLAAYIRVKAGKSKSSRGKYTRSTPFFEMSFDSINSALGILLQKDDMIESTAKGKLIMKGAPEFGAQIGSFMMIIAKYAT